MIHPLLLLIRLKWAVEVLLIRLYLLSNLSGTGTPWASVKTVDVETRYQYLYTWLALPGFASIVLRQPLLPFPRPRRHQLLLIALLPLLRQVNQPPLHFKPLLPHLNSVLLFKQLHTSQRFAEVSDTTNGAHRTTNCADPPSTNQASAEVLHSPVFVPIVTRVCVVRCLSV